MNRGDLMNVTENTTLWRGNRISHQSIRSSVAAIIDPDEIVIVVGFDALCPDEVYVLSHLGVGWILVKRLKEKRTS
jgi:hypothetical protein